MQLPLWWNTEKCTTEVQSAGCKGYQICLECLGICTFFPLLSLPHLLGGLLFSQTHTCFLSTILLPLEEQTDIGSNL